MTGWANNATKRRRRAGGEPAQTVVEPDEMNSDPREARLPQWAQEGFRKLRARVRGVQDERDAAQEAARVAGQKTNPDEALIVVDLPDGTHIGLPEESEIRFHLLDDGRRVAVSLTLDGTGVLLDSGTAQDKIAIQPVSGLQLRVVISR